MYLLKLIAIDFVLCGSCFIVIAIFQAVSQHGGCGAVCISSISKVYAIVISWHTIGSKRGYLDATLAAFERVLLFLAQNCPPFFFLA
jgi:hypothetical protein